jgi:hypothetical protein
MSRIVGGVVCLMVLASPALADEPKRLVYIPRQGAVRSVVDSHILFINRCKGGCVVKSGASDSRYDTSDVGQGTLAAYPYGDNNWNSVMTCVKSVMSPFNIQVTDVDPGTVDHFEVMVGGNACDLNFTGCQSVAGIADFAQNGGYFPDALVFDFTMSGTGQPLYDCGVIAQEIAHSWGLDHVVAHNDPLTYNTYQMPLAYHDGAVCGSDCQIDGSGQCVSPFNAPCSGSCAGFLSNETATHTCFGTGTPTQDEVKIIKALFGPAGAAAPTVTITAPAVGKAVQPGFEVDATCTSADGVQELDFSVDGVQKATLTTSPAKFTAPSTLTDGSHTISILCATNLQATATAMQTVIVGEACMVDSDCTKQGYICYEGACIAGPNATGGLGNGCTKNADCSSNTCASDGTTSACVVPCDTSMDHCPTGFGCLGVGTMGTSGVCFPGAAHGDSGGGCCETGHGGPASPVLLSGTIAALWITRRRRRKSHVNS